MRHVPIAIRIALLALAGGVAFGAVTWWALESGGVAVVATRTPEGGERETHVWYAHHEGRLWLEAGTPENPWFQDVLRTPRVTLSIDGDVRLYVAQPTLDPAAHEMIRARLREKYGFRDWWVNLLVDTSDSVAVHLAPVGEDR